MIDFETIDQTFSKITQNIHYDPKSKKGYDKFIKFCNNHNILWKSGDKPRNIMPYAKQQPFAYVIIYDNGYVLKMQKKY